MARHYLGILWGVCLLAPLAWADQVTSGELALEYQAPWQRAEETEERDEDSIVLRWTRGDSPFTLYLPRHRVRLNITEAQFHDQLERKWRAKYGSAAEISWRELGSARWHVCRRPGRNGGTVFHLVSVENGIAHYLLAILPGEAQSLPAAADSLLASARWLSRPRAEARATPAGMAAQETAGSGQIHLATAAASPVAVQETTAPPAAVIPPALAVSPALPTAVIPPVQADGVPPPPARAGEAVTSAPLTAPPPAPAQVAAVVPAEAASSPQTRPAPQVPEDLQTPPPATAPTPPPVAPPPAVSEAEVRVAAPDARPLWKLARVVASVPRGARLLDLAARIEREQKGHLVITGYGLKHFPHGLEGFLDGYGWQAGPRDRETRVPFGNRWEVRWNEPPAEWRAGMPLTLTFEPRLRSDTPPDTVSTLPMRLEWFTLCGPRKDMLATFNALDWAEPEAPRELRRLSQVCRPATPPLSLKADLFADAQARQQVELQPPANWPVAEAGQGEVRRLVLAVDFPPGNASPNAADSLRAAARIYYIYTPEE